MIPRLSVWEATADVPDREPLRKDARTDVCVVGAGIAGLSTAYFLAREGKSVIVLDQGPLGGYATRHTTAHLSNAIDRGFAVIERLHGAKGARLTAESHAAAIDRIQRCAADEDISCGFSRLDGFLFLHQEGDESLLDEELDAARRAGLLEVEKLGALPGIRAGAGPCLRFPYQAQFHPLRYLSGLISAIERHGGRLHAGTHVDRIEGGSPAHVENGRLTVTADAVVVATNAPINNLVVLHTKLSGFMTYAVAAPIPPGAVPPGLYWDTADPYHYVRLQETDGSRHEAEGPSFPLLIVGGEDHRVGQAEDTEERFARLATWARERFPAMGEVLHTWTGEVMETLDGLAYIGHNPLDRENVYVATGDCGMGMTHGTIAGMLITDQIMGRENPWSDLYDPSRKTLRAAGTYARETLNMVAQYADWLSPGDAASEDQIARGTGAVLRHGLTKVACYRDEDGRLHSCSAVCTHLGGIVHWNQADGTWDCPCHGSRFDRFGAALHGPANHDLGRVEGP